ncbi:protein involved in polysaccharide export with SLBB domain [Azospirillum sp. OGB3]|uniref:SLBB domain-containing protein n=1 Tax=Azospirillum sp. OGB3 TaxID=2587012 RepID=UPI0017DE3B89|nr:SLBB domain-containing protein [Azospirillum sp. OGB3]MBB3268067.1 protein involved in polysaccharide export with SLBB domain [Azospirillum sp. OGB3]
MAAIVGGLGVSAAEPAHPALHAHTPMTPPQAKPAPLPRALSPIEAAYSERAGSILLQFGYDQFGDDAPRRDGSGGVQSDYTLGAGDELLVTLRGQKSSSKRHVIDAAGLLTADDVRPVLAQGLTLAELRAELADAVTASFPDTEVYVSVTEMRRIGVLVTGAVARPGRQEVGAFATLIDALTAAGGVTRAGSLRRIRLFHAQADGSAPSTGLPIDLYDLFMTGDGTNAGLRLRDGDRLFVPPLGPTVGLDGPLKRPGVYELPPGQDRLPVAAARDMAGGLVRPGAHRALRYAIGPSGEERAEELSDADTTPLTDGDLLLLTPRREDRRGDLRLDGHVLRPGPRALERTPTIAALVSAVDLGPTPYLPFAVLASTRPGSRARVLQPIDLGAVLNGRDRRPLAESDTLYVLSAEDVDFLTSEPVLELLRGARAPAPDACRGLVVLARALMAQPDGPLAGGPQARAAARLTGGRAPCPTLFEAVPDLLVFALEHSTLVMGGVARPGFYPSTGRGGATELALAAGGTESGAYYDTPSVGGASQRRPTAPGDILEPDSPAYELTGHARRPGVRLLARGATLRDALSGGDALKRDVYPLLGVIERFDRRTLARRLIPFSPQEVASGRADRALADGDRLRLFSTAEVQALTASPERDDKPDAPQAESPLPTDVAALVRERGVQVRGAVRTPGSYPVAEAATVEALLATAGGPAATADPSSLEITTAVGQRRRLDLRDGAAALTALRPGDSLRINPAPQALEARAVTISGAVRRPGSYDVARGETLSSLIDRAGGLTEDAYPAGTSFLRDSERKRERAWFDQQARDLERWMVQEVEKGEAARSDVVGLARQLATQLRGVEPLGRIVVEADPQVLRERPELDVLLEPDDRVIVPKRPLTVTVTGEVLHPTATQFVSGKTADAYLREAGGASRNADDARIFLVLPDGRAQPLSLSSWNHTVTAIPPGSSIVVPRDPKPFDLMEFSKNMGTILGQLAISAAAIAVISE